MTQIKLKAQQSGIVLISVLLIFAATTAIVAGLQIAFMRTVKTQGLVLASSQAREYMRGAELLASIQLEQDVYNDLTESETQDDFSEAWAQPKEYPIDGGSIKTQLIDLQGRFNVLTLNQNQDAQQVFLRLLQQLQIPSDNRVLPTDILNIILDWIDTDQMQRGFVPSEDDYYLSLSSDASQDIGYRTANQPFVHLSELLLLNGVSKQDYAKLAPYIVLLPIDAKININSVSYPLAKALNPSAGEELVTSRPEEGFTASDMATLSQSQKPQIDYNIESYFFELRVEVSLGDAKTQESAILYVPPSTSPDDIQKVQILQRDLGWDYYYTL